MQVVIGSYAVIIALLMAVWWLLSIRAGALTRPDRTRAEISLHLAAELLTAAVLGAGGVVLLAGGAAALVLVGLGMLLYTAVASPGYFLARRELPPVIFFGVLAVLTTAAVAVTIMVLPAP